VLGYLKAFLFTPDRARTAVKLLSGGERNRLLLARLFAKPSNVLVLDEPTNDLDVETLELLESLILNYPGTVILVSHDRAFVNAVVDSLLVHEGERGFRHYVGDYDDWLRQRAGPGEPVKGLPQETRAKKGKPAREKQKLSYKETLELEALPSGIESLEEQKRELLATLNSPAFYADRDAAAITRASDRLKSLDEELDRAYRRWEELESLAARLGGEPG